MRKIPFAGIELTSQRVRGYMVPLSYRGDRFYNIRTLFESLVCLLLVGILQWKVSEFRFGGLNSASYKDSARKFSKITSLRSIWNNFTKHLQLYTVM